MLTLLFLGCAPSTLTGTAVNDGLDAASAESGVPREVLAATAWALSRLEQRDGAVNELHGVGVMDLRDDGAYPSIDEAARLADLEPEQIVSDVGANLLAGAMVLAARAEFEELRTGERVDTLEEWYPVVAAYSGVEDPLVAMGFADQVFDVLARGMAVTTSSGELVEIDGQPLLWRREAARGSSLANKWVPASTKNYTDDNRSSVKTVVIHTTEGSYSGAISWLQNPASSVSAHYVIRSSDGEITQMVQEEDIAWHAGDWDTNKASVGIEHEGYISDPGRWYTDAMYRASAALTRDVCDRYGIPKDRSHVIAHAEVPGCSSSGGGGAGCHTDPGSGWDWNYYMSLVTGTGSGSSSMGGTGLPDGAWSGRYTAQVDAASYGKTDTCDGDISGAASGGQLYLQATCRLKNNPDASGNMKVTWTGTASGDTVSGTMVADGRSVNWTGTLNKDGTISARYNGSKDVGGTVGVLGYAVDFSVAQ